MNFLGQVDGKLMDFSEAGIVVFLTWFALSWKQELSEVAIVMERKLRVRPDRLRLDIFTRLRLEIFLQHRAAQ